MTGNEEPIRLERLLSAPVEDVFDAMTDPARMADWFSPIGRAEVEADPVVGGRLHVVMSTAAFASSTTASSWTCGDQPGSRSRGGRATRTIGQPS